MYPKSSEIDFLIQQSTDVIPFSFQISLIKEKLEWHGFHFHLVM